MTRRIRFGLIAAFAVAGPLSLAVSGQNYSTPPALVVTAFGGKPAPAYKVPMTPWGDPDLQGTWSSDDTDGINMARGGGRGGAPAPTGLYRSDEEIKQRAAQLAAAAKRAETDATSTFRFDFG